MLISNGVASQSRNSARTEPSVQYDSEVLNNFNLFIRAPNPQQWRGQNLAGR